MSRAICYSTAAVVLALCGCTSTGPRLVERRDNVEYIDAQHSGADRHHQVDVKPEPVGGMRAFVSRLNYPRDLRRRGITGVVWVRVAMDSHGHVTSASIVQSVHPVLDQIVLRAVRETDWTPAMKDGKAVPWTFRRPITFTR